MNIDLKDKKTILLGIIILAFIVLVGLAYARGGNRKTSQRLEKQSIQYEQNWRGRGKGRDMQNRGGGQGQEKQINNGDHLETINQKLTTFEIGEVSEPEKEGLILMREEEKLAHDVYVTLYEKWDQQIFSNIASSESNHSLAVLGLLDRYSIDDPVKNNEVGVFNSLELQKLYNDLVSKGSESLLDALIVGATIEDLDIFDLNRLISEADNEDIIFVYENLSRGSRNHMRSFTRQIENNGGKYSAQYLTENEINTILSTEQERGNH